MHVRSTERTSYQWLLVGLLSLNFGVVFFDRNALGFLMPFIQPELHLSNTMVGALASALSLSWAVAGLLIGRVSDVLGRRKPILVGCTVLFSCASLLSGIASTFAFLMAARLLMGIAEGGVMPISQTLIAAEVLPARRGLAMGVAQNFGANLLGNFLGPVAVVAMATSFGWRSAFYLSALPGLLIATAIALFVVEPPAAARLPSNATAGGALREVLRYRNIIVCSILSVLLVGYLMVLYSFMPLFLVQVRGFDQPTMSWLMATVGLSSMAYAFLVPGASDVVGRRPVLILIGAVGVVLPLAALFFNGTLWQLFALFAFGSMITGIYPLFMATIPAETVAPPLVATVLGLIMGTGEILGGVLGPVAGGVVADGYGLRAAIWILVGLAVCASLLALTLNETAPAALSRLRTPIDRHR